jgi:FlaA1/EpsC-like NDP-sugar epimerase
MLINQFLALSRASKRMIMLVADACILIITLLIAFSLRVGEWYWPTGDMVILILIAPLIASPIFIKLGLYHAIIRYIGLHALWAVIQAVSLYALLWAMIVFLSDIQYIPYSVTIINWVVAILLIGGSRLLARWWVLDRPLLETEDNVSPLTQAHKKKQKNIIIYGAGSAGIQLLGALKYSEEHQPVAFIDDNKTLYKQRLNGLRIYALSDLDNLIESLDIDEILLAIPSAPRKSKRSVIAKLENYSIKVKTLPSVAELAEGKVQIEDLREVSVDDLLGRDSVAPDVELLSSNIKQKVVMVTGAGGSIGSELCRQIIALQPSQLILFEQSEFALYQIERELLHCSSIELIPVLGSVMHQKRVERVCQRFNVQTIYHATAYKHVPMVEKNPIEGVQNNIFGTLRCALAAISSQVETFVLISTDKAVRPTNTMGATKRFAELILQALAQSSNVSTRFTMVRFGNVLGSSGSVVPLFREQIRLGGPITVTDPNIIRYFMTIPEAAQLVIQAGAMGQGGDVFVLDMGEPVRILDLAKRMIHLSGLDIREPSNPRGDIEIIFTGLRPGEKLYEELLIGDNVSPTQHPRILRAEEEVLTWKQINILLKALNAASIKGNSIEIRQLLRAAVLGFEPQCAVVDVLNP